MLFDSVAPAVKMISFGCAPKKRATEIRASSSALSGSVFDTTSGAPGTPLAGVMVELNGFDVNGNQVTLFAVTNASDDLDAVMLDLLATAATVALLSASQVDVDVIGQDGHARWQVLDEDRQLRRHA